jgi:hypothetical protein
MNSTTCNMHSESVYLHIGHRQRYCCLYSRLDVRKTGERVAWASNWGGGTPFPATGVEFSWWHIHWGTCLGSSLREGKLPLGTSAPHTPEHNSAIVLDQKYNININVMTCLSSLAHLNTYFIGRVGNVFSELLRVDAQFRGRPTTSVNGIVTLQVRGLVLGVWLETLGIPEGHKSS